MNINRERDEEFRHSGLQHCRLPGVAEHRPARAQPGLSTPNSLVREGEVRYLIDTILRGRPIPKVLISQKLSGARTVRTVVDGQQRLRAILGFINGDFAVSRAHNPEMAGSRYPTMPEQIQHDFLQYELGVDVLFDLAYEDLLDIFARINSYTVTLNKQERLNAKYLGYFKQATYKLGYQYVDYFLRGGIMTKANVARMGEAELAGELLAALTDSVQTNKATEQQYKKYEDDEGPVAKAVDDFDDAMSHIGTVYPPEELAGTNWSRIHLFYTLFTAIAHCLRGLRGLDAGLRCKLTKRKLGQLRVCLDQISVTYDAVAED